MNTEKKQLVVIAAGPAGLAAAIEAVESGLDANEVIVLEKTKMTGGTANMGMGPLGIETRQQREGMMGVTREKAFKQFMTYTHWRSDSILVKKYIDKSADTIEWLEGMGVRFVPSKFYEESEATWHYVIPDEGRPGPRAAGTMMRRMTERADALGIKILLETWATGLRKEDGKITGVYATNAAGEELLFECVATVIATGGFASDHEFMKKYTGYTFGEDIFSYEGDALTGDGIKMAWEAGAGKTEMHMELNYRIPDNLNFFSIDAVMRQPNLMVNLFGERFYDEGQLGNGTFTTNAIDQQKNRRCWIIMDESIKKRYEKKGLDLISMVHGADIMDIFDKDVESAIASNYQYFVKADTIEELCAKTGIDQKGLEETIETYNHDCEGGRDTLFNKDYRYMKAVKKAPYYAACFCVAAYGSLGGIKVNHKLEVITQDFEPIPGLYGAGTDVCSIYGDSYVFQLPGNTMGFALNSGRMAGENAAEYIAEQE